MNDSISREVVISAVKRLSLGETDATRLAMRIGDYLKRVPSAQPERIKGRWIKISPAGIYECSVCGQNVMTDDIDVYHYCHGCGADMRESR